jgi:hypothetical protein
MLVFIEGGPEMFANQAFDTSDLLDHPLFDLKDYRWTSRVIHSKLYPEKSAQVWRHVSVPDEEEPTQTVSPIQSATENSHSLASDATTKEVNEDGPLPMRGETAPERAARISTEYALSQSTLVQGAHTVEPAPVVYDGPHPDQLDSHAVAYSGPRPDYTGEPVQTEGDTGDLPDGEALFLARKRLKMTVQQVADEVKLKRSRVDAIEKGTAVRGDVAGDLRKIHEFLSRSLNAGPADQTLDPDASVPGGEVETPRE